VLALRDSPFSRLRMKWDHEPACILLVLDPVLLSWIEDEDETSGSWK
jgi:hypothetical protein